jgi:hypothetical protein
LGTAVVAEVFRPRTQELYHWRQARDARLVEWLVADGLTRVYVRDFWEAYRLTFDAGERVVFAEPRRSFYPPYTRMVDTAARYAYVMRGREVGDEFEANLVAVGGGYRRRDIVGYAVFDGFAPPASAERRPLAQDGWRADASHDPAGTARAFDGDPATVWTTGPLAGEPAYYRLDLGAVRTVAEIAFSARSPEEAPRGFRLEVSQDGERWTTAVTFAAAWRGLAWDGGRMRLEDASPIRVRFEPVRARLLRIVPLRLREMPAWSIAELSVWTAGR